MVKNQSLSSDLDLIKEFEELKLKQKILISSLNNKSKDKFEIYLLDISKKIDFLVKIFKDVNENETSESEDEKSHFEGLDTKLNTIISSFEKNFEDLNSQIISLKKIIENKNSNVQIESPKPDFKVVEQMGNKKVEDDLSKTNVEKKDKKKWF